MFRYLKRSVALVALLGTCLPVKTAAAADSVQRLRLPAPSASDAGWFGIAVGFGLPKLETTVGSAAPDERAEGITQSGGSYRFLYEKQLLGPLGLRGFMERQGWTTDLADNSGDGDRVLYDLGGAPVLSYGPNDGPHGVSLYLAVPFSYSFSSAPSRAKHDAVLESMNVGHGYRYGLDFGILLRLAGALGLAIELGGAGQHVEHVRRYKRIDGVGGELELPIQYDFQWFHASVGLGVLF